MEERTKIHVIFDFLKDEMGKRERRDFLSADNKIHVVINNCLEPNWINVIVTTCSKEIDRLRLMFDFFYERNTVNLRGSIRFRSPLGKIPYTYIDEGGTTVDNTQLDALIQLIEKAKECSYSKIPKKFQTISGSSGGR